ncbi:hypothetical protein ACH4F6_31585 [Streptomyces sp. NPDC017936]|uniref:hypothetical protein n=1 Tax=Streptomyces sp. NPDC017936 TaxID=3365016 RepID=UPI00378A4F32
MVNIDDSRRDREVARAREVLADAEQLDFSNRWAIAWMLGRMEQTVKSLVYLLDEEATP